MELNRIVLILLGITALWFFIKQGLLVQQLKREEKARRANRSATENKILQAAWKNGGTLTPFQAQQFTRLPESSVQAALENILLHHEAKVETLYPQGVVYKFNNPEEFLGEEKNEHRK